MSVVTGMVLLLSILVVYSIYDVVPFFEGESESFRMATMLTMTESREGSLSKSREIASNSNVPLYTNALRIVNVITFLTIVG